MYGCHGYIDPTNRHIVNFYAADANGYHVYSSKDLNNLLRYDQPQQLEE